MNKYCTLILILLMLTACEGNSVSNEDGELPTMIQLPTLENTLPPTATEPATVTPSETSTVTDAPTEEPTATITDTPVPTQEPTFIPGSDQEARATAPYVMDGVFDNVSGVISVGTDSASLTSPDSNTWLVYAEIRVQPGFNTVETAEALQQAAFTHLFTASIDFSVILDDGNTATDYVWNNRRDEWIITPLSFTADSIATEFAPGGSSAWTGRTPENCTDAVAMGLTAEQAAQYDHLDRDKDGVACYGD